MYLKHKDLSKYEIIDIEADGLADARVIWCLVSVNVGTGIATRFVGMDAVRRYFRDLPGDVIIVGHNALSYDIPTINRILGLNIPYGRVVDTLVLSQLYHPKLTNGHSLQAWGERLAYPKGDWSKFDEYDPAMVDYCENDCRLTLRVFKALTDRMRQRGFSELSCEIEHKIHVIIDRQMANGFHFNIPRAEVFYAKLRQREQDLTRSIHELFRPELVLQNIYKRRQRKDGGEYASYLRHLEEYDEVKDNGNGEYATYRYESFNIGSAPQRIDRLLRMGYQPTKFTPTKRPKVDEESLIEFSSGSGIPEVQAIADWLVANGRANMVNTWLNNVDYTDSRMHGRVFSCGAASRRMTHSAPNSANIPSNEATYGTECRSLWDSPDGRELTGYDAKSIQMRCFANLLPDPNAGRKYWDTDYCADPHQENADLIGIARKPVKNVFYANMFGAYPPKLATTAGATGNRKELQERGEWIRRELYRTTPGLEAATLEAQYEWRANQGFLGCVDGGFVRCPGENAALNYKIQPAEACVMKLASIYIDENSGHLDHLKVGDIHDESQHETDPRCSTEFGELSRRAIRIAGETLGFRVPLDGSYAIGPDWSCTH